MITNELKVQAGAALGLAGLVTWLNCRPLGIIFCTLLAAAAYKQVYPNARIIVPCEVQNNLNTIYESFTKLRKDKPGIFCVIISTFLTAIAITGQIISGTWIVLGVLLAIFILCAKYQIKLVNGDEDDEAIKINWGSQTTDHEIDEFLPDVCDELNLSLLKKVSENDDVSQFYKAPNASVAADEDEEDDEVPSDLLLTSDRIPEIEEEEATASFPSSLEIDEPMRYDAVHHQQQQAQIPHEHFGDSSDDSDDSISRGLNFNDVTLPDAPCSGADGNASSVSGSFTSHSNTSHHHNNPSHQHHQQNQNQQISSDGSHSPSWNIVNNLWDAAHSTFPEVFNNPSASTRAVPSTTTRKQQQHRVKAELSSDESDFELLDTDDLNIHSNT